MTYVYVMLFLTYSGDVRGLPIMVFGDPAACITEQSRQERAHQNDFIAISACMQRGQGGSTIGIQIVPEDKK